MAGTLLPGRLRVVRLSTHPKPVDTVDLQCKAAGVTGETHPTAALSEIVHQRHRLGILTIASRARQADFGYLQEALGLTSGNLSTHVTVLEDAGLVRAERGYQGRRARTWVSITRQGRAALAAEMAALASLVHEHDEARDTGGSNERDT